MLILAQAGDRVLLVCFSLNLWQTVVALLVKLFGRCSADAEGHYSDDPDMWKRLWLGEWPAMSSTHGSLIPPLRGFCSLRGELCIRRCPAPFFFVSALYWACARHSGEEGSSFIAVKFANRFIVFGDYRVWWERVGFEAMCQLLGSSSSCHALLQHCSWGGTWLFWQKKRPWEV